jgi:hypothetical protein
VQLTAREASAQAASVWDKGTQCQRRRVGNLHVGNIAVINPADVRFTPKKRTFVGATGMSAKGQQQSFRHSFDHGTTMEGTISVTIRLTLH